MISILTAWPRSLLGATLVSLLLGRGIACAADYTVLHTFPKTGNDGQDPVAKVLRDATGNLYGTTQAGGAFNRGTVFKISPEGVETVVYSFTGGNDGADPVGGLIMDASGTLYGTTASGGDSDANAGVVFKLTPDGTETVLYAFTCATFSPCPDGSEPGPGTLVMDATGNLYGTTISGGIFALGTVFKLAPDGIETVLHAFTGGDDGGLLNSGLVADDLGNLYGTAYEGGIGNNGVIYKITPDGAETTLYRFQGGTDGAHPMSTLLRGRAGTLFGTTISGGAYGRGTVFRLKANGVEKILHSFGSGSDGATPRAGVVRDRAGNFYGTTLKGGGTCANDRGCGTIYKLASDGTEIVLHAFIGRLDGKWPQAELTKDLAGNLYGTTMSSVQHGGNVFKITP